MQDLSMLGRWLTFLFTFFSLSCLVLPKEKDIFCLAYERRRWRILPLNSWLVVGCAVAVSLYVSR